MLMVKLVQPFIGDATTVNLAEAPALVTIAANPALGLAEKDVVFSCTVTQMHNGIMAYNAGALLQDAFPFLDAESREILKTGLTSEDWERIFS